MVDNQALMDATMGQMVYYENDEGRICILFPLHGKVMIGSTDIKINNPDEAIGTDEEVEYMLSCVRQVFPKLEINLSQVVFKYSGVRPLPNSEGDLKNAQISRDHSTKVIEPTEGGLPFPILSLIGGKWTTFRAFGEQTADKILTYLHLPRKVKSTNYAIGGGKNFPKTQIEKVNWIEKIQKSTGFETERINTLLDRYGINAEKMIDYLKQEDDSPLYNNPKYSRREIEYLLQNEFVLHLDDLILRRTVIALSGELTSELLTELADIFAEVCQLNLTGKSKEIERTKSILLQKNGLTLV